MAWDDMARYLPDGFDFAVVFPLSLLYALAVAHAAAWLKSRFGWKTNYSRKFFHVAVFTAAFVTGLLAPEHVHRVAAYGAGCGVFILVISARPGHPWLSSMYNALAREQDEPHRTYHLLAPFAATAVGGIATGVLFDGFYQAGYLVAGLGDAAGEPVGVRFGRHRYRVPTLSSVKCFRSLEGSAAVLLVSFVAAALALHGLHCTTAEVLAGAVGAASCAALTEALSPHGWDNLTTQLAACLGAFAAVAAIARAA
jgi:phytol kinase